MSVGSQGLDSGHHVYKQALFKLVHQPSLTKKQIAAHLAILLLVLKPLHLRFEVNSGGGDLWPVFSSYIIAVSLFLFVFCFLDATDVGVWPDCKKLTLKSIKKHSEDNQKSILNLNQFHYHLAT